MVSASALTCCRAQAQTTDPVRWHPVADVGLPGPAARFDYQTIDGSAGRLWIAHMGAGEVLAFDLRSRQVAARVPGMPGVTGLRAVPELGRVFAALSSAHAVAVLDSRKGQVVARIPSGRFPDGLAYAPRAQKLYVSDEYGRQELVIDVPTSTARRPVPLGGEAGNTQYDPRSGHIWVAVQTRDELAEIDPGTDSVVGRLSIPGVKEPHGFSLDSARGLAYVSGEGNATLAVVDLGRRAVRHTYSVGSEPDVVALDPVRRRLFIASESGVIAAFETAADSLVPLDRYLAPHAHSVAVDPATGLIYVPLQDVAGRPVLRILRLD